MARYAKLISSNFPRSLPKFNDVSVPLAVPASPVGAALRVTGFKQNIKIDINGKIEKAIKQGTSNLKLELETKLDQAVEFDGWGWTKGTRDIVDTGNLKNSASIALTADGIDISYDAPYAGIIHYGGYIQPYGDNSRERVFIPGRPWIESLINGGGPIDPLDYEEAYYGALFENLKQLN